jgi:AcrR family transcriptional regulator
MPRPRFERLPEEKRVRILEAAAKEFTGHGYENASLNQILEGAQISKGAAYYYFDDKADLFLTTLRHYVEKLQAELPFDIERFSADAFWFEVADVYRHLYLAYYDRPWVLGITRAGGPAVVASLPEGSTEDLMVSAQGLMAQVLQRGHELGLIRVDLPNELLHALIMGIDEAHDRWFYAHRAGMSRDDVVAAAEQKADTLRRLLTPKLTE